MTGFDVHFDATTDSPTVWVVFKMIGTPKLTEAAMRTRGDALRKLRVAVQSDIYDELLDWSPRLRFEQNELIEVR